MNNSKSVPIGFKFTLSTGQVMEQREDGVYLDGIPARGPYFGCKTTQDRRRRAAEITNAQRRESTQARIIAAKAQLIMMAKKVTVAAIAKNADVSRQAIYKHYRELL